MKILFNPSSPSATIPAHDMSKCYEGHIQLCLIPQGSTVDLPNMTKVEVIGDKVFARGVNSCFYPVQTKDGKKYWVHEDYVR